MAPPFPPIVPIGRYDPRSRVDVAAGEVRVQGIDLLDETPILDLKSYLPNVDAWSQAGHGWLDEYLRAGIEPRLKKPIRPLREK